MDIITELVKEKYLTKEIFRMKKEIEIAEAEQFINNELDKTELIRIYKNYTLIYDTIEYMKYIQNREYDDIYELVDYINMCGYNITIDEHDLYNDDLYEYELELDIQQIVEDDFEEELSDFYTEKEKFEKALNEFTTQIKVIHDVESGFLSYLIFEYNEMSFRYSYLKEEIQYFEPIIMN